MKNVSIAASAAWVTCALFLGACGVSAGEDAESDEAAKRISPTDIEADKNGTLLVDLPPNAPAGTLGTLSVDGQRLAFGTPLRLLEGPHQILLDYSDCINAKYEPYQSTTCLQPMKASVQIVRKTTKRIVLPILREQFTELTTIKLDAPDFGDTPSLRRTYAKVYWTSSDGTAKGTFFPWQFGRKNAPAAALLPGSLRFEREGLQPIDLAIPEGADVSHVGQDDYLDTAPPMLYVDITMPDRELPDVSTSAQIMRRCGAARTSLVYVDRNKKQQRLRAYPNISRPGCDYVLNVTGAFRDARLDMPIAESGVTSLRVERLDVDDVTVTPEDGRPAYTVKGDYTVRRQSDGVLVGSFATNSGLDLPPAVYTVELKYTTPDGARTQVQSVDLR